MKDLQFLIGMHTPARPLPRPGSVEFRQKEIVLVLASWGANKPSCRLFLLDYHGGIHPDLIWKSFA